MPTLNYYELLGVAPDAPAAQIEAAFKRLATKYHPEANPGDQAAALVFRQLCAAFRVLKNPATRQRYDRQLREASPAPTASAASATPETRNLKPETASPRPFRPPSSRSPVHRQRRAAATTVVAARPALVPGATTTPIHGRRTAALLRVHRVIELAKRVVWWSISAAVHALLIWIMARWPYVVQSAERLLAPINVSIRAEVQLEELEIGIEIKPEEPAEIQVKEESPEPIELDPLALSEAEREAQLAVIAVEVAAGPFRLRTSAGREGAIKSGGATVGSESSVNAGLRWLKVQQKPTGAWHAKPVERRWANVGLTGLAVLAFQGAGHTHYKGTYRRTVGSALAYLKSQQGEDGAICFRHEGQRPAQMYLHSIATLALAEAYAMTKDPTLRERTQLAVDFLVEVQRKNPTGGWRYYDTSPDGDASVSGWAVMALRSAKLAGLDVSDRAFERARKFFASVTDKERGHTAYMPGQLRTSAALTAVGLLCHQYLGIHRDDPYIQKASLLINSMKPQWLEASAATLNNFPQTHPGANAYYYWYYANLALHQRRDEAWEKWHPQVRELLVKVQEKKGRDAGSWPPKTRWASVGGRVYSTALAVLTLEIYYRYAPMYKEVVDKVLAAYGRVLTAYNQFARLARKKDKETAKAREKAIATIAEYLELSAPKEGEPLEKPTHKRRGRATQLLVRLHRHAERYEKTIALLELLRKSYPELVKEPAHTRTIADLHLVHARKLFEAGQKSKAKEAEAKAMDMYYDIVVAEPRANARLELWLAEQSFKQRDWERAADLYKQRVQRLEAAKSKDVRNSLAFAYRRLITCYGNRRRHRTAALWLERLEKLLGPTLTIRRERAALAERLGRIPQARRIHESIIPAVKKWSPDYWQAWGDTLRLMIVEGRRLEVVRRIDALAARRPGLGGPQSRRRLLELRRRAAQEQ